MTTNATRAEFEAWCTKQWGGDRGGDNFLRFETDGPYFEEYRKGNIEFAWCAWAAAQAALAEKQKLEDGAPYGIIDPDYARAFTIARCTAWQQGYALATHGSFTRDLDLIAVPWTDQARDAKHLVARIAAATGLRIQDPPARPKPHGRLAWSLLFPNFGDPRWIDFSVMPRIAAGGVMNTDAPTLLAGDE